MKVVANNFGTKVNDLIYMVAKGNSFLQEAEMCVTSIQRFGNFKGNLKVFTNTLDVPTALKPYAVVVPFELDNWKKGRFAVRDLIVFEQYNRIVYIDTDMLCLNPLDPIFDSCKCGLTVARETNTLWKKTKRFISDEKYESVRNETMINSGFFCISASECYSFLELWDSTHRGSGNPESDQVILHKLYYEGLLDLHFISESHFAFPMQKAELPTAALLHYCGRRRRRMGLMRKKLNQNG